MTRDEIMAMKPGRELDVLIYAMIHGGTIPMKGDNRYDMMPCYSTDIAAAWQVVEKMPYFFLWRDSDGIFGIKGGFECRVACKDDYRLVAYCKTAPEAICKAALLAVCEEVAG